MDRGGEKILGPKKKTLCSQPGKGVGSSGGYSREAGAKEISVL